MMPSLSCHQLITEWIGSAHISSCIIIAQRLMHTHPLKLNNLLLRCLDRSLTPPYFSSILARTMNNVFKCMKPMSCLKHVLISKLLIFSLHICTLLIILLMYIIMWKHIHKAMPITHVSVMINIMSSINQCKCKQID